MYCRKCGAYIKDDARFCPICGEMVVKAENDYQDQMARTPQKLNNNIAIVGLIFAFISPIVGWILGGIGLRRSNQGYNGRVVAILALIVATANFVLNIYLMSTGKIADFFQ